MKNKELKSAVRELLHQVGELNVRVTQLEYPPKEVIKNDDKFAELKEAHKNGAVIQFFSSFDIWEDCNPSWDDKYEYRIKPEDKPKVGDVVMAWDNESSAYTVGKVIEIGGIGYFLQDDLWWDNAEVLTQQEAIDLLFEK